MKEQHVVQPEQLEKEDNIIVELSDKEKMNLIERLGNEDTDNSKNMFENFNPLLENAARLIVDTQIGSTALIQRRMKLGYNRAGRIMDQLEAIGVV